jgi:hypothetical protein
MLGYRFSNTIIIEVKKEVVLLNKTDLEFENKGVLNPRIVKINDFSATELLKIELLKDGTNE